MTYPDWFTQTAKPNFEKHLIPLAGQDELSFLQLGVYTGDASLWMLQNLGKIKLTDVDTWQGSDEQVHKSMNFEDVYNTYLYRIDDYEDRVSIKRMTSVKYLLDSRLKQFDFIYIDADHTTAGVLLDAELSWPLLKSGGILAFDDYTWTHESGDPRLAPQVGIDLFLHRHEGEYQLLTKNTQVWIKKA